MKPPPSAQETLVSPALRAANRKLHRRRLAQRAARTKTGADDRPSPAKPASAAHRTPAPDAVLATHLGWYSAPLTAHLRQIAARRGAVHAGAWSPPPAPETANRQHSGPEAAAGAAPRSDTATVPLAPDLAAACLRHNLAGAARIWLLLRHLDRPGRGWLPVDEARSALTRKGSPLRVCGWRQLRNLLCDGQGIFWQQDGPAGPGARLWLRKPAKVAATLGLQRLAGRAVALPLRPLLGGMAQVRAHLYAAFHSGRSAQGRPIARETITRLTGVPRRTQITYEDRAGIEVRHNFAVGERATPAGLQERAWQRRGTFRFVDRRGKQGKAGGAYVAWQMPNTYLGPHEQHSQQRTKRINADLADLRTQGGAGNGREPVDKLYFAHGAAAARAFNRDHHSDTYWPFAHSRSRSRLWFVLAGRR